MLHRAWLIHDRRLAVKTGGAWLDREGARAHLGMVDGGAGSKLRRVVDSGRQRETVGDSGRQREKAGDGGRLLLRVSRASAHEQETRTEQNEAMGKQ